MKNTTLVMKKELARVFSDKRMIFSLFILPALIMLVVFNLVSTMIGKMNEDIEEHRAIVYIENAPEGISDIIKQTGYNDRAEVIYTGTASKSIEEIKTDILNGDADLLVSFDPAFMDLFNKYSASGDKIPGIKTYYNSTKNYSSAANSIFSGYVLDPYRTYLQSVRFGNLDLLTVFTVDEEIIADEKKQNGQFLSMMLPYIIVMMLFASAMSLCVDAVAGEKERGTLATLLLSPVKRSEIAFGKMLGLSILSSISAIVYAISSIFSMGSMGAMAGNMGASDDADSFFGKGINIEPLQILGLVLIMITLVYFFVAITCFMSILAKDTKQASSLVSPLYIVVVLLGMITMFTTGKTPEDILYCIPVYGSALAIQQIAVNSLTAVQLIFCIGGNVICAALVTFGVKKAFDSEKIMFNA